MIENNPIYRRELLHQRRCVPRYIQVIDSVGIVTCVLVLAMSVILYMLRALAFRLSTYTESEFLQWAQVSSWSIHGLVVVRTILAGIEVIYRDGPSLSWDDLKLLSLSPLAYLLGKWWAAVYRVRGWMLGLGIMHLVLVGLIGSYALLFSSAGSIQSCYQDITRGFQPGESCNLEGYWQPWYQWSTHSIPLATSLALAFSFCDTKTGYIINECQSISRWKRI